MRNIAIEKLTEFDDHKLVAFLHDDKTSMGGFIAIHRGDIKRPSFGATRLWKYSSEIEALRDALRLSRMMSYKLVLAGLPYGGAKGVLIARPKTLKSRVPLLKAYAERVNYFGGRFITGTDVGLTQDDLYVMRRSSPYMVGLKGDATRFTAVGIFHGIKVCLGEVFGSDDLGKRTFAIQGVGKVGGALLKLLYRRSKKIFIADLDPEKIRAALRAFPRVEAVKPSEIHRQAVDVFSPCALSHAINKKNVAELSSRIVAGGANSQLEDSRIGDLLYSRGILYAPDYVINAGGLISVVDEYEHKEYSARRVFGRVIGIKRSMRKIFRLSKRYRRAPHLVADEMAEKNFNGQ